MDMDAPELTKKYNISVAFLIIIISIVATATYTFYNIKNTQTENSNKVSLLEKDLISKNNDILKRWEDEKLNISNDRRKILELEKDLKDLKRKYWIGYRKRKELESSIYKIDSLD